jgi:phosphatidylglycerophosphatase C
VGSVVDEWSEPTGAPVAAFDLDGTLTSGHSLPRFVVALIGRTAALRALGAAVPAAVKGHSRSHLKASALHAVLAGKPSVEVGVVGHVLASEMARDRLQLHMAATVEAHRRRGHQLVLVTAALDAYAAPMARILGFDALLAPRVEVVDGVCTGRVLDADMNDDAKPRALRAWLGDLEPEAVVFAYGDSRRDEELLRYAAQTRTRLASGRDRSGVRGRTPQVR